MAFRFLWAILFAVAFFLARPGYAHDIKVLASKQCIAAVPAKTTIYLSWGHRLPVDDLVDAVTIERYDLIGPGGETTALKKADLSLQANVVEVAAAGLHQAAVVRKQSVYTYVFDSEGVRQFKRGPKTAVKEGKIDSATRSQQFAKAMIAAGKPSDETPKALGHALEIVPLDGPSRWNPQALVCSTAWELPSTVLATAPGG